MMVAMRLVRPNSRCTHTCAANAIGLGSVWLTLDIVGSHADFKEFCKVIFLQKQKESHDGESDTCVLTWVARRDRRGRHLAPLVGVSARVLTIAPPPRAAHALAVDAFIALGGNMDKTGQVSTDKLRNVVKEFGLTIDINRLIQETDTVHPRALPPTVASHCCFRSDRRLCVYRRCSPTPAHSKACWMSTSQKPCTISPRRIDLASSTTMSLLR